MFDWNDINISPKKCIKKVFEEYNNTNKEK